MLQLMQSNLPSHWQNPTYGVEKMLAFREIQIPAEMFETITNKNGDPYTHHEIPSLWLSNQGLNVWGYFDAVWPTPSYDQLSPPRTAMNDPYWLRKQLVFALRDNPEWRLDSWDPVKQPLRYRSNAANAEFRDFFVDMIFKSNVPRFMFDDHKPDRLDSAQNEGWFDIYQRLRNAGIEVVVNGCWTPADPYADSWTYPASSFVDGVMVEHWMGHRDGMNTNSGWWVLHEDDYKRMALDWHAMGKKVYMVVRYRGEDDTVFTNYEQFGSWYATRAEDSKSFLAPLLWNAFTAAWMPIYKKFQAAEVIDPVPLPPPDDDCPVECKESIAELGQLVDDLEKQVGDLDKKLTKVHEALKALCASMPD